MKIICSACSDSEGEMWTATLYGHNDCPMISANCFLSERSALDKLERDILLRITAAEELASVVEQLDGIGIPDWNGAEGLDLARARELLEDMR